MTSSTTCYEPIHGRTTCLKVCCVGLFVCYCQLCHLIQVLLLWCLDQALRLFMGVMGATRYKIINLWIFHNKWHVCPQAFLTLYVGQNGVRGVRSACGQLEIRYAEIIMNKCTVHNRAFEFHVCISLCISCSDSRL